MEAFAGVSNPFSLGILRAGERVVDLGSGGSFDCFIAAEQVGTEGHVVGIDMMDEMLSRSCAPAGPPGVPSHGPVALRNATIADCASKSTQKAS